MSQESKIEPGNPVEDAVLIVLAAGVVTQDYVSVLNTTTPAMLPYMGRPLIYQVIVNHIRRHGQDVIIAIPENERRLEEFLLVTFGSRVNLVLARIRPEGNSTPVTSLLAALNEASARGVGERPAFIVHGDIYFEPADIKRSGDAVVFVDEFIPSDKYSFFAGTPGAGGPHRFIEPATHGAVPSAQRPHEAKVYTDIGAYWVPSINAVQRGAMRNYTVATVGGLLSGLYQGDLKIEKVLTWSDLGHLDTATRIRTKLIGAREFNSLSIDEERGLITKRSTNRDKILQELNYYHHLPKSLSIYFPRLHDFSVGRDVSYTTEYYSYRTLAEYLVFFSFPTSIWHKVMARLVDIHSEFGTHSKPAPSYQAVHDFYIGKLQARMSDIKPGSALHQLTDADKVVVNGVNCPGWKSRIADIETVVDRLARTARTAIIHGDLCFSNILYDPQTGLIKLIDPRGDFFDEGCYGDPRYDLAKLLHSFHGGYDFIMQEMYDLREISRHNYVLRLFRPENAEQTVDELLSTFNDSVADDLKDLMLLEALLFLSMLPLHSEDLDRQKALYLTGIRILGDVFDAHLH